LRLNIKTSLIICKVRETIMEISWGRALWRNFLGQSPDWYKLALIIFLIVNPLIFLISPFVAGWLLVAEFIFTLAMALKCYPLLPGGLLAIEAVFIGMTSAEHVREEVAANLEVLLLLMFMVAGIYFMKQLLLFIFTRLLLSIRSKMLLSLSFCVAAAFLSAFLDALTVVAVVISVAVGFYGIYHRVASSRTEDTDLQDDSHIDKHYKVVLEQFRGFLRSLMMHAGVGTALGGVMTMVGEPQNLIIAKAAGWHFGDFFLRMSPVTVPVLICGLLTCLLVEKLRWFGYGETLPEKVREVLQQFDDQSRHQRTRQDKIRLIVQAIIGVWLVTALALHLAEVGLISLSACFISSMDSLYSCLPSFSRPQSSYMRACRKYWLIATSSFPRILLRCWMTLTSPFMMGSCPVEVEPMKTSLSPTTTYVKPKLLNNK
jgi:NhaB family Na+:H+ antiporter